MLTRIKKWGNSLAVRIPKALADETGLDSDSPVEMQVVDGEIRIMPVRKHQYELDALLEDVTPDNRHEEVDTGDAVGNESW